MDPFSITVGALGITEIAIASISSLRDRINGLAEARETLQDITAGLDQVQQPLRSLEELKISDETLRNSASEDLKKTGVVDAVNKCGEACADFEKKLKSWTKHSSATKLSLRDRLSVGLWNREKIANLRTKVGSCQAIVQFAVQTTQLIVQLRSEANQQLANTLVDAKLQALEEHIATHLELTQRQYQEVQTREEELQHVSDEDDDDDENGAQQAMALVEVKNRREFLEAAQVSCGVMLSQVRSGRTGQRISNVVTADDSEAFVGMPESVVGKIDQIIDDVRTTGGSVARVGVFSGDVHMGNRRQARG